MLKAVRSQTKKVTKISIWYRYKISDERKPHFTAVFVKRILDKIHLAVGKWEHGQTLAPGPAASSYVLTFEIMEYSISLCRECINILLFSTALLFHEMNVYIGKDVLGIRRSVQEKINKQSRINLLKIVSMKS